MKEWARKRERERESESEGERYTPSKAEYKKVRDGGEIFYGIHDRSGYF